MKQHKNSRTNKVLPIVMASVLGIATTALTGCANTSAKVQRYAQALAWKEGITSGEARRRVKEALDEDNGERKVEREEARLADIRSQYDRRIGRIEASAPKTTTSCLLVSASGLDTLSDQLTDASLLKRYSPDETLPSPEDMKQLGPILPKMEGLYATGGGGEGGGGC